MWYVDEHGYNTKGNYKSFSLFLKSLALFSFFERKHRRLCCLSTSHPPRHLCKSVHLAVLEEFLFWTPHCFVLTDNLSSNECTLRRVLEEGSMCDRPELLILPPPWVYQCSSTGAAVPLSFSKQTTFEYFLWTKNQILETNVLLWSKSWIRGQSFLNTILYLNENQMFV